MSIEARRACDDCARPARSAGGAAQVWYVVFGGWRLSLCAGCIGRRGLLLQERRAALRHPHQLATD